jgi:hypothetical protein
MRDPHYRLKNGVPEMRESFLIFLDILGYQGFIRAADTLDKQNQILTRLHSVLSRNTPLLRQEMGGSGFPPWYASRIFTDNIVLSLPIALGNGERELGSMMLDAGLYQMSLAVEGFFVRGGIAVGPAYVDEHVVFGPALVEAYDLEQRVAVFPRIVLSKAAREYVGEQVGCYLGGACAAPHNNHLLVDRDGEWFVNYIDAAHIDRDPDSLPEYRTYLEKHRDRAKENIRSYRDDRRVLEKYLWIGRYHNYVTRYLYPEDADLLVPENLLQNDLLRLSEVLPSDWCGLGVDALREV